MLPRTRLEERAARAARNYGEAWERKVAEARAEVGNTAAAEQATASQSWRFDRIAATETPGAFNEARGRAVRKAVKEAGLADRLAFFKTWNAELEACPICWDYDGETVPIHESYSHGHSPGAVHPHCRCTESYGLRKV